MDEPPRPSTPYKRQEFPENPPCTCGHPQHQHASNLGECMVYVTGRPLTVCSCPKYERGE